MKCLPNNFCDGCRSHSAQQGAFTLHRYHKGAHIVFPDTKNYMIFVLSGNVQVCSEAIGIFDCPEQHIMLWMENGAYTVRTTDECVLLALSFDQSFFMCNKMTIEEIKKALGDYRYTYHSLPINEPLHILLRSVVNYLEDDIGCISMHSAKQLELFAIFRFYYSERELAQFFVPTLDRSMHFESLVKANCFKAKSVEELAALCGYTLHNFKKIFKLHFRLSPYQWMLQQNKAKILTLLLNHDIPIKAIAADCGFTCQSHLNRYCNRYLGATSGQIRSGKAVKMINNSEIYPNMPKPLRFIPNKP